MSAISKHPRNHRRFGWVVVSLLSLVVAGRLAWLAPDNTPARRGNSAAFWYCACSVNLEDSANLRNGCARGPRDGWYYYENTHFHGTDLYRVPAEEVVADFDRARAALEAGKENNDLKPYVRAGYENWQKRPEDQQGGVEGLLLELNKARLNHWKETTPEVYDAELYYAFSFEERWVRGRWYWATVLFEWLFLSSLVLFALWPWVRGQGWRGWALHLGLLPLLFMLPVYFGYATMSFTSAGPSGGVLYPWLLIELPRGSCNALDRAILMHLPPILEPLSPTTGPAMVLSGRGMPGPTNMVLTGFFIAGVIVMIVKGPGLIHRFQLWRQSATGH
jgi:hypothetical protein